MKLFPLWILGLTLATGVTTAFGADADVAEKDRIRSIVREVLREYAAALGDKQVSAGTKEVMNNVVQDNRNFVRTHGPDYFKHFVDGQHPRATVVTCADSRVHAHAFDATPDGDLFMVRNMGAQIMTAEGTVEYGVRHLHTPLLLIVGHTSCGAVKAASGDYSGESAAIRRELDTLRIPKGEPGVNSVKLNVHHQVRYAMNKFETEVLAGKLTVVGAVYDFRNDLKLGQGKLTVINVNGETDPAAIAALELMKQAERPVKPSRSGRANTVSH